MASNILNWTDTNSLTGTTVNEQEIRIYRSEFSIDTSSPPAPLVTLAADTITYTDTAVSDGDVFYYVISAYYNGIEKFSPEHVIITSNYIGSQTTIDISGTQYALFTFSQSGTFTLNSTKTIDYLIVGGGGAGGVAYPALVNSGQGSGGGGGGNVLEFTELISAGTYNVVVGLGGVTEDSPIAVGRASTFNNNVALGGGGGEYYSVTGINFSLDGGNGGGGGALGGFTTNPGGVSIGGNGFSGGDSANTQYGGNGAGGGGGGAGAAGQNGTFTNGGDGGNGIQSSINNIPTYYGGGGGGLTTSLNVLGGLGGLGGGGRGQSQIISNQPIPDGIPESQGVDGLGGGAGASLKNNITQIGKGGDGVVYLRYPI